jgi:adenylate cyclase
MGATEQRKLAAIMFTDMVGYSALTQRDEALALNLLQEHHDLLRDILPMFQGNEIKSTGDGLLVEFSSALAAVQCAVEIQRILAERNEKKSEDRQITIRIGIHLGDVVMRGDDVLGDGVNIAARIEPLAEPGGVCITRAVFEQIENKVPQSLVQLSKPELKNISANVEVYKLVLDASPADLKTAESSRKQLYWVVLGVVVLNVVLFLKFGVGNKASSSPNTNSVPVAATTNSDQPSIAVLAFANLSEEKDNEFFSDGISEELLNVLAKVPGLKVSARTSAFFFKGKQVPLGEIAKQLGVAYVVEGSVR